MRKWSVINTKMVWGNCGKMRIVVRKWSVLKIEGVV